MLQLTSQCVAIPSKSFCSDQGYPMVLVLSCLKCYRFKQFCSSAEAKVAILSHCELNKFVVDSCEAV